MAEPGTRPGTQPGTWSAPEVLAAALERLDDGVVVLGPADDLRYANPAAADLLRADAAGALVATLRTAPFAGLLDRARADGAATGRARVPGGSALDVAASTDAGLLHVRLRPVTAAGADPERLEFLGEVGEAMVATLDVAEAADRLVRLLVPRLADWATLTVLGDDDTPGRTARAHRDPSRLPDVDAYLAGRRSGARDRPEFIGALLAGRPVRLPRLDPSDVAPTLPTPETRAAWERLAPASALFVPLRAQGGTFGVLSLLNGPDRPPHTGEEVATAVEVARRGSLALDNARLYSRQVRIAETLQRSLLTPPLRTDALDVAVRYRPASSSALVGGDFYDAFEQDDAAVLVVGDVAGHALEAATAMAQLRSAVRTLAWDRPESPARTLTRVDRALTGLGFGTLATVLVARVEPGGDGRTLRWSSAGHPPPMLAAPSGRVQVLQTPPEALLGAEMTTGRSDHEAVLRPGETLVLYTDGLVEHRRRTIDEGTARLAEALSDLAHRPLEELCDELLDRLLGDRSDDDVVLLAARPA